MLPMPQIILSAVSVSPTLIWCIIGIAVFLLLYNGLRVCQGTAQ